MISRFILLLQKYRIPISSKLIAMTLLLLATAIGPIVYQSTRSFSEVSEMRELEANLNIAAAKASEADSLLQAMLEKAKSLALLSLRKDQPGIADSMNLLLSQDRDLLNVDVLKKQGGDFVLTDHFLKPEKLKEFGTNESELESARSENGFSLELIAQGQIEIKKVLVNTGVPILAMAFPLERDELGQVTSLAIAYAGISKFQRIFRRYGSREIFLVDRAGRLLSHPSEDLLLKNADFSQHPMFQRSTSTAEPRGHGSFQSRLEKGDEYFGGAYARTVLGPVVLAQMPEDDILEPARLVGRRSLIITGFVISFGFLFVFLLSLSLVNPIETLAGFTRNISKGNFEISARSAIRSHDEVGDLAEAFDDMVMGLRERDKVKSLFSKFHGSSITEDLLNKDVAVGGTRKNVTVFFSDIRGFTSFSESRTPEEVVDMLNEYFSVMVGIINRHGGIVDKFIGDAIMAVWGAPQETPNDMQNAVKACLEMRKGLAELNEKRIARGDVPIMIGMGLHSGHAISGTIGSDERMEYTVIGDTVNMTSRIEASTKSFGTDLLVSSDIALAQKETFWLEKAGDVEAKGKSEPLTLYKVKGEVIEGQRVLVRTPYSDYTAEKSEKIKVA